MANNYVYNISTSSVTCTVPSALGSGGTLLSTAGSNGIHWGTTNSSIAYTTAGSSAMVVNGDLNVNGNVTVKGRDLVKLMEKIEDRLAILVDPDPKKLEKFEALKKAYDHYKLMEKLIGEE